MDDHRLAAEPGWEAVLKRLEPQDPREIGGYLLRARIGEGGMGAVFLSFTPGGRPVAVKVARPEFASDPEFRRRFAAEVAIAQRVQGIYTAPVVDSDPAAAQPWLATAYVAAPSLAAVVGRQGALPPETALLLVAGIAEALQVIHAAGVIHRDLKPANVILAADGPRVIDFGISRAVDASSSALTQTGVRIGTPAFMAPEQVQGKSLSPAGDVFSLGSTAYYAASGQLPFGADAAVFYRVEHHEPDWDRCPAQLRSVLAPCLAKDPSSRPTPAAVMELCRAVSTDDRLRLGEGWLPPTVVAELTRYSLDNLASLPPPTPPTPPTPSGAAEPARSRTLPVGIMVVTALVVAALLVGVYGIVNGFGGDGDGDPTAESSSPSTETTSPGHTSSATTTAETSETPTTSQSSPPQTPRSPTAPAGEPQVVSDGTFTLSDDNDGTRHFDVDRGRRVVIPIGDTTADLQIDLDGRFAGENGSLAPTAATDWETCSTASGFGAALGPDELAAGTLLCGNTSEGRTFALTVEGALADNYDRVASVTFSYTTWALPEE